MKKEKLTYISSSLIIVLSSLLMAFYIYQIISQ